MTTSAVKTSKPLANARPTHDIPDIITAQAVLTWAKRKNPHQLVWQRHANRDLVVTYLRSVYGVGEAWAGYSRGVVVSPSKKSFLLDVALENMAREWTRLHAKDHQDGSRLGTLVRLLEDELKKL